MVDRFNQKINVGDRILFATSGEMAEGICHKVSDRPKSRKIVVKNSSGYNKDKVAIHCINLTVLYESSPHLAL